MPLSGISRLRTDGQINAPRGKFPYVPFYSVLFWYGKDADFANTYSGTLNLDYYRQYSEIYYPSAVFYNANGSFNQLQSNPMIACVALDANWQTVTGSCVVPTISMPNTATTLFDSFTHGLSTLSRSAVYPVLAIAPGDSPSTSATATYIDQSGDNIHAHDVVELAQAFRNLSYGELNGEGVYDGINAIAVDPILRDPTLSTNIPGYNDTKLNYLPKNIIVFANTITGANAAYYTQDDSGHVSSANGKILPLIAKDSNDGVLGLSNSLIMVISSNTVANHDHNSYPATVRKRSSKASQKAYNLVPAGSHSHKITYTANVALRSKILRAWITTSDQTPIANGVIIGYSINRDTAGFSGTGSNSYNIPLYWHFCNGTNGTPDLRGYYIYANFDSSNTYHDVVYNASNTMTISSIVMEANGNHSHAGPLTGTITDVGTPVDIGAHSFEDVLNHTHTIAAADEFKYKPTDTANVVNVKASQSYSYTPPTVNFAFIMYNENVI
jgi:hypothetical protein